MRKQLSFLLLIACLQTIAKGAQELHVLDPGKPVERVIAGGETHTYEIKLTAGQFMQVIVEQRSIDVALSLTGPDSKPLIESDMTSHTGAAREALSYEGKANGFYQLAIRANGVASISGMYRVRLEVKAAASELDRKRLTAEQMIRDAASLSRQMDFQGSVDRRQQALVLWRELGDLQWEGDTLRSMGSVHLSWSHFEKAVECYEQALAIRRKLKDRSGEADSLLDLGDAYRSLGRLEKSLELFGQALSIEQELGDRRAEGVCRGLIGWVNYQLGHQEKALEFNQQALVIAREVQSRGDEGSAINGLASAYGALNEFEKAAAQGEQYLEVVRELKSRYGEASALNNLAIYYRGMLRYEKSIEYFEQASAIFRELKDRQNEALSLRNLGDTYTMLTRLDKAVESYQQALTIYREIKDRQGEALALGPLGNAYSLLGQPEKSIECFEQALPINRDFKNRFREAGNLNGLGNAYELLGRYETAIEFYEQALAVARQYKIRFQEATMLNNLGEASQHLGRDDKAIEYAGQGLVIARELKARGTEAAALLVLGNASADQAQYTQAIEYHQQGLRLAREIRNRDRESEALLSLMRDWQAQGKPAIAIFFGKQAVNLHQDIRSEITRLEKEFQQSYIKSKEQTYRELADLLIGEGRLPEAEQVINMLKDEEYFDFIRRDAANAPKGDKAQLTPEESALEKRYREIADQLASIGSERGALMEKKSRTPEEEQRLAKLDADLVVAGNAFQKFLSQLETELGSSSEAGAKAYALRESQGLMEDLSELGKGTVALYTLVGEDRYRVVLTTPDFQKGYEYPIKAADLNRKVLEFREVLQNPKLDPMPLAQELYRILVGPVAKDLKATKAQTLMWSLDGSLRYLPVAALHDGKQYLVEQYRNVVFTPASQARLKDEPARNWDALGLGVSKAHGERIPALPGVVDEMRGIIRDESTGGGAVSANQAGVLPGVVKLDEQFTQESMLAELRKRHKVVHIASHFQFQPGNETNSALLLGDGSFLSLAQIKSLPNIFSGVDLLTLSACNTATGGAANGKEVEGFGVLAQRQGAKAVVASLWPVADRSTKLLMQEFYHAREAQKGMAKIEALREAQLKLLRGQMAVDGAPTTSRQIVQEAAKPGAAGRAAFKTDGKVPFAHPYYWAPFILIGNWK